MSARLLDTLASPVKAYLEECCELDPNFEAATKELFAAWLRWCEENGREHPGNEASFGRDLHAARPEIRSVQRRVRDGGATHERVYVGARLRRSGQQGARQHEMPIDDAAVAAAKGPPEGFDERW